MVEGQEKGIRLLKKDLEMQEATVETWKSRQNASSGVQTDRHIDR